MKLQKIFSSILLVVFCFYEAAYPFSVGEEKIVIAVVDFRNTRQDTPQDKKFNYLQETIPEAIITRMSISGRLEIVERARLREALKEMGLGAAGVLDEETAIELGRTVGANAILLGSFVVIDGIIRLNARLIDVKTSRISKAESVQGGVGQEIFDLMDQIAESMETQLVGETGEIVEYPPPPNEGRPFYKAWWFWTVVGVGVAGGGAALALAGEEEKNAMVMITVNIP